MPARLVSPDCKLFLVDGEGDLKAVAELYKLTPKELGNIRQLLGEAGVGNGQGDRNDRNERKRAKNWVLLHEVSWLKHDNGTEYVPLVGGLDHKFKAVAARPDMNIGSMGSLKNLLNGSKTEIRGWRKVPQPRQVFPLRHGMSLVGLQDQVADSVEHEGSSSASASASAGSMMGGTAGSATSGVGEVYVAEAEAAAEAHLARALHESMADEHARIARVEEAAVQESIAQLLGLPPPSPAAPQVGGAPSVETSAAAGEREKNDENDETQALDAEREVQPVQVQGVESSERTSEEISESGRSPSLEDHDMLEHVGQDILDDLDMADALAISEGEAKQRRADAKKSRAELRSVLRASHRDQAAAATTAAPAAAPVAAAPVAAAPVAPVAAAPVAAASVAAAHRRRPQMPWARCSCGDEPCGKAEPPAGAKAGMVTVSVKEAQAALQLAAERGAAAGAELAGAEFAKAAEAAVAAVLAEKAEEKAAALADLAVTKEAEKEAVVATLTLEIGNVEEVVADVTGSAVAAERALLTRISALEKQLGGTNWLSARGKMAAAQSEVKSLKAQSEADRAKQKELSRLLGVGPRLRAKGEQLHAQLSSEEAVRVAMLQDELAASPKTAKDVDLDPRHLIRLVSHMEQELFAVGGGDAGRTKLIAASLMQRPAVQRLLGRHDARVEKLTSTATKMLEHAAAVLSQLSTGRGSRSLQDHQRFETIIAALVPDDASDEGIMRAIGELLGGLDWRQLDRAQKRNLASDGSKGAFSQATKISRKRRKDYRGWGRSVAIDFWHKHTRLDTRLGKKKRHREVNTTTGSVFYREHWRHVQYDTNEQIADAFFESVDYQQYLEQGGKPFSRDIFLQSKCFCIDQSDFQECACPHCTLMRETTRGWHQQRKKWHFQHDKEGAEPCVCGACSKGSAYREASGSLYKLREFVHAPCGKANFPELTISCGPKSTETVQLYRRQCCRAPPPNTVCVHRKRAGSKGVCDECGDCSKCGWAIAMPSCPIESGAVAEALMAVTDIEAKAAAAEAKAATEAAEAAAEAVDALSSKGSTQKRQAAVAKAEAAQAKQLAAVQEAEALQAKAVLAAAAAMDAEWKEYRPRIEPDGKSYQDELVTIKGTRKQLQARLATLYETWSPHDWMDRWATHQRHLTYATFENNELCISTDFSAQYDHKASCTRTCENPRRSNMDVFIVTHSPRNEYNERVVTTDVWRIFSEAKGSALFHNKALDDIVKYYSERLDLKRVYVFSDGCRSQYKGRKNFVCVAQFPSRHNSVELVHRFAASHHFKGPHDAYGKDAKHLARTAERHGKARLATTHNLYYFCATTLPRPRRGVTAEQLVTPLPPAPAPPPPALSAEEQAAAAAALAGAATREAAEAMAKRMRGLGMNVAPEAAEDLEGVEVAEGSGGAAEAEAEVEAEAEAEAEAAVEAEAVAQAEALEAEAEQARAEARVAAQAAEQDAEPDEELGDFEPQAEFVFAEDGTRVGDGHAEPALDVPTEAEAATAAPPLKKQKRAARTRQILCQAPGTEASSEGEARVEVEKPPRPGLFTASNYFWLYYSAFPGLKEVPVGQLAEQGQCHGYLDDAMDADADSIPGSNSTYEFSGVCPDQPEMLYTRTYACACRCCRELGKISTDYSACPFMATVGAYEQQTIHHEKGVAKQRTVQLMKTELFAKLIKADSLYAAFASFREKGNRDYWLLRTKSVARQATKAIKVVGGTSIRKGAWVVEAQWYSSTSDNQGRKSYKLLPETVHVPVGSLVQEVGLQWRLEGRTGGESHLSKESHAALVSHNFSNVV